MRFTQTPDAFYITTLYAPNATLVLDSPVPYVPGDEVTVVGGNMSGAVVPSELLSNGSLRLNVSDEVRDADEYAWVFKIAYGGGNGSSGGDGGSPGATSAAASWSSAGSWAWNLAGAMLVSLMVWSC